MKTLQLEQLAVSGCAEEPSVVSSRMRLVFSTLEVRAINLLFNFFFLFFDSVISQVLSGDYFESSIVTGCFDDYCGLLFTFYTFQIIFWALSDPTVL